MAEFAKEMMPVNLEEEMRTSYLDYAMSVIVGRALPDVRDGLKPVHRRVLYAMHTLNNDWNKPYKKSARVVGDVIGKYHPHGDAAVYDTIVRLAQDFTMRYPLVDGQGNFGSIDGDNAAAMRYTEVRMARLAHELLTDIDRETVDFVPNYDGAETEPAVLPSRVPNLLVNGAAGIAVGMATNIPPHNLREVIDGCVALIDDPERTVDDLLGFITGPDFPTAGIINGRDGILSAYRTGRGSIRVRGRVRTEEDKKGRQRLVIHELPYMVNKARLVEKVADLVKDKKIEGISDLRDESDKDGIRVVIELKRGEEPEIVLNNLYKQTQLESVFGITLLALDQGQPRTLNLKEVLEAFVQHRREVVTRRTLYDLRQARKRAHTLEGLAVALANLDPVINLIRQSPDPATAKQRLTAEVWEPGGVEHLVQRAAQSGGIRNEEGIGLVEGGYKLSPEQAQAILDMRLHRLTGLERDKVIGEFEEILDKIDDLLDILRSEERLMGVIRDELVDIKERFGDERRTEIQEAASELTLEDLVAEEDMVVTMTRAGYIKRQPLSGYRAQRRGGKGKAAAATRDAEDFVERLFVASTHQYILCFSNAGKVYWLKVYELPEAGRTARGKAIVNLLPLEKDERITTVLPVDAFEEGRYVVMATSKGVVKRVDLMDFSRPRKAGIIAIKLDQGESLVGARITGGNDEMLMATNRGKAIRFPEQEVRIMGRNAHGVRGIEMAEGDRLIGLQVVRPGWEVLTVTENGFGKRTPLDEYRLQGRGGQGILTIKVSERNGEVVSVRLVHPDNEVMLVTSQGTLIRTPLEGISRMGRNTQGVRLIDLAKGERVVGAERVEESAEQVNGTEEQGDEE
ncbi:DNA gyrase subunit A [Thiohalorhabdus denitrificans]|uniref:DNA gyrase subunit A n=1 Tax=Thiohalorhabdus denitrificans TaxID=381306 RepID=A0A0P9CU24_9GAMM|nr:DNA gyrase subunit A [Thiohalorhabdus denitrificans]KPV40167.1 DNA gyrase subunit A [Thiohalorhabdus denitrificans]SCY18342.1 DNA gyrase subunit A [Thiohalorhabdus denitrificans]